MMGLGFQELGFWVGLGIARLQLVVLNLKPFCFWSVSIAAYIEHGCVYLRFWVWRKEMRFFRSLRAAEVTDPLERPQLRNRGHLRGNGPLPETDLPFEGAMIGRILV